MGKNKNLTKLINYFVYFFPNIAKSFVQAYQFVQIASRFDCPKNHWNSFSIKKFCYILYLQLELFEHYFCFSFNFNYPLWREHTQFFYTALSKLNAHNWEKTAEIDELFSDTRENDRNKK